MATRYHHGFLKSYALIRDDRHEALRLWGPSREVQQDLLLSSLTISQAYCLLKVLK